MSDNKKYYYLKLKDNFFDQDNIKVLESMENGDTYIVILLKIFLKSLKGNGRLMMTDLIPYDPSNISLLSKIINKNNDMVEKAIKHACELGLLKIVNAEEIWVSEMQSLVGTTSTEGIQKSLLQGYIGNDKC